MKEADAVVRNEMGLHIRMAGEFVKRAQRFKSDVFIECDGLEVNGKSIMGVIMLAADRGTRVKIRAAGPDEDEAVAVLKELVDSGFGGKP